MTAANWTNVAISAVMSDVDGHEQGIEDERDQRGRAAVLSQDDEEGREGDEVEQVADQVEAPRGPKEKTLGLDALEARLHGRRGEAGNERRDQRQRDQDEEARSDHPDAAGLVQSTPPPIAVLHGAPI